LPNLAILPKKFQTADTAANASRISRTLTFYQKTI